ncbi:MAG: response regulator [Sulfuricurvum sp.]|nr:response regulator [Sulfuricurvum sp.]
MSVEKHNEKLKELKNLAEDICVLYVEDNSGLRQNIQQLLHKLFTNVFVAEDGLEGYQVFSQYKPKLIITDINMPKMNGLDMAKKIKVEEPNTKIIYITAYSEKEYLFQAIEAGVYRYLPKPAKVNQLIDALYEAVKSVHYEESKHLFDNQLKDIFNYQNNLLLMFKNGKPVIVNQRFLDFFSVENIEEFFHHNPSLESMLKEHQGFLYTTETGTWFETAVQNPGKLYHTKIIDHNNENRHLIMKLREIPEKQGSVIVSFDDVTELNLLGLYDKDSAANDKAQQDKKTVLKFMKIVNENHAEVKLHNFYRGLTITNPAVIVLLDDERVILKTSYSQLKIVKLVKNMTISSEIFPSAVLCKLVQEVDFDKQTIHLTNMQFIQRSGNDRQNTRLEPEENHKISLFLEEKKFFGEIKIIDISIVSVKLELNALPPAIAVDQEVNISMVLPTPGAPLNINTPAKIYRIDEYKRHFHIVLIYNLSELAHKNLMEYLAQRQMALIREFKALEINL